MGKVVNKEILEKKKSEEQINDYIVTLEIRDRLHQETTKELENQILGLQQAIAEITMSS